MAAPRADRDRRRYRTLELPADDGRLEARACPGCGERPGAETVRADTADDAPIRAAGRGHPAGRRAEDRKSTRLNSSHRCISYAVFCLKKKKKTKNTTTQTNISHYT